MSLSTKIAAILTVLILSLTAIGATVQNRVFGRIFSSIESEEAGLELLRVQSALDAEIDACARSARRVATHERTRAFTAAPESGEVYSAENLSTAALRSDDLDLVYVCTAGGEVLGGTILDPVTGERTRLPRDFPGGRLAPEHPAFAGRGSLPRGMITTGRGPMLIGTARIQAPGSEAPAGFVIAGRFLSGSLSQRIADRTQTDSTVVHIGADRASLPADMADVVDEVTSSAAPVQRVIEGGDTLAIYGTFDDVQKRPVFLVRARLDRRISAAGATALASGALTDATLGIAILLALLFILNAVVVKPLGALTSHAVETGRSENFRARFRSDRSDELGTLGSAFDEMMGKLEEARAQVVDTARAAGMSEIATGILHNVGNVLNSVNLSAALVSQRVDELCVDDLRRLSEVLTEHAGDLSTFLAEDPRGQHIQPFLSALVVELGQEKASIRSEVDSLSSGIEHICELIKSQQDIAKGGQLVEPTDFAERFDEALRITQRARGEDGALVVVRRFEEIPEVAADRHKVLQILVNLVQNALQAMDGGQGVRELTLEIARAEGGRVHVAVADTGCGIAAADLVRVFHMGFTTREEGNGFGLHSAANAATEMGGRLRAESEGPGRGARFVLELPVQAKSQASVPGPSIHGGVSR